MGQEPRFGDFRIAKHMHLVAVHLAVRRKHPRHAILRGRRGDDGAPSAGLQVRRGGEARHFCSREVELRDLAQVDQFVERLVQAAGPDNLFTSAQYVLIGKDAACVGEHEPPLTVDADPKWHEGILNCDGIRATLARKNARSRRQLRGISSAAQTEATLSARTRKQ
jgi:hypothetical protein